MDEARESWYREVWNLRSLARGARALIDDSDHGMSDESLVSARSLLLGLEADCCKLADAIERGKLQ